MADWDILGCCCDILGGEWDKNGTIAVVGGTICGAGGTMQLFFGLWTERGKCPTWRSGCHNSGLVCPVWGPICPIAVTASRAIKCPWLLFLCAFWGTVGARAHPSELCLGWCQEGKIRTLFLCGIFQDRALHPPVSSAGSIAVCVLPAAPISRATTSTLTARAASRARLCFQSCSISVATAG